MLTPKNKKNTVADSAYLVFFTLWIWVTHPRIIAFFIRRIRYFPRVIFPKTINDKFIWRKIFDHDPRFVILSDKLACKKWVSERIPELRIAKVLWAGNSTGNIPRELIGKPAILKANHGCGTNYFLNEANYDLRKLEEKAQSWLRLNHGKDHGEWAYSQIRRKIFLEEIIEPKKDSLTELKIYTFGDKVGRIVHIGGRLGDIRSNAWNIDNDDNPVLSDEPASLAKPDPNMPLPASFPAALRIARKLGKEFDHLRVDLLYDGVDLWLGELTVYNQAGYMYIPSAQDPLSSLSKMWDIQKSGFFAYSGKQKRYRRYISILSKHLSS
jgi:hypothetical protein